MQRWILATTFTAITLQFWTLLIVAGWLAHDSYALEAFPKAHPVVGTVVGILWIIGDFGGLYFLVLALAITFWWLTIRKPPEQA